MIDQRGATRQETAELRGGTGGSHAGGWPYILASEPWPACPCCRAPIPCFLQLDMRDALHPTPPAHRLFVVYRCDRCTDRGVVVRHYAAPAAEDRRPLDPAAPIDDPSVLVMVTASHALPDVAFVEYYHPEVVAALSRVELAPRAGPTGPRDTSIRTGATSTIGPSTRWAWARSRSPTTSVVGTARSG